MIFDTDHYVIEEKLEKKNFYNALLTKTHKLCRQTLLGFIMFIKYILFLDGARSFLFKKEPQCHTSRRETFKHPHRRTGQY